MKAHSQFSYRLLLTIFAFSLLIPGCGRNDGPPNIELELIEATTELPAKVRLFFRVDLGEEDLFAVLQQEDFEIYEDNSLISSLESKAQIQNEPGAYLFSSVLLLDLSGSVLNGTNLPRVKDAAESFIESVMPGQGEDAYGSREMAVYWFDGEEEIHSLIGFSVNKTDIIAAIRAVTEDISEDNSTNLNGAVVQGLGTLEARLGQVSLDPDLSTAGSMVIFTDGTDQAGRVDDRTAKDAVKSMSSQYSIFTIGLGAEIDERTLEEFGRNGFEPAENSIDLNTAFLEVAKRVESASGSFYVLEYCSPKRDGEHEIQLRALYEDRVGNFTTKFSAEGFTGGCSID